MIGVRIDVVAVMPAAFAFLCRARGDFHAVGVGCDHARLRGDQHEAQVVAQRRQQGLGIGTGVQGDFGLQRRADAAGDAHGFQLLLHLGAHGADAGPALEQIGFAGLRRQVVPGMQEHRVVACQLRPHFLAGERQDRRHPARERVRQVVQRVLRGTPCAAVGAAGVEAVLQDVEVEAAEVFRAEALQLLHDEVEFVGVVMRLQFALQLARQRQRVAVDFQPVLDRQRVRLGIEVGQVGEQEFQGVADPAIAFHHALEDLVRDGELARIVGGRHPQSQDVGAVLVHHLLRRDDVALRLAHLVALAVDHEAVGEQGAVGRAAVGGAAGEQATTGTSRDAGPSLPDTGRPDARARGGASARRRG